MKNLILPEVKLSITFDKKVKKSELYSITCSEDAFRVAQSVFNADLIEWKEEMFMLCLNRSNKVLGYFKISSGGVSGTICDPKIVFSAALNVMASGIIVMHNHPSGNLKPSSADILLTKKLKEAGNLLDIHVLDHLIVTDESYYSFADEGTL